jgi:hypothetical protein
MKEFTFDMAVNVVIVCLMAFFAVYLVVLATRLRMKRGSSRRSRVAIVVSENDNISVEAVVSNKDDAKKEIKRILSLACDSEKSGDMSMEVYRGFSEDGLSWFGTWVRIIDNEKFINNVSIRAIPVLRY